MENQDDKVADMVFMDPELSKSQAEIRELCMAVLSLKPTDSPLTFEDAPSAIPPMKIMGLLRNSSLSDLLLENGATLGMEPANDYYPDINLVADEKTLSQVSLRAWLWESPKQRINPRGPSEPPYNVLYFPGEKDWSHQLDINFVYSSGENFAMQTLSASTGSHDAGSIPFLMRSVFALDYAETGYEGHNRMYRSAKNEEEALLFLSIARKCLGQEDIDLQG